MVSCLLHEMTNARKLERIHRVVTKTMSELEGQNFDERLKETRLAKLEKEEKEEKRDLQYTNLVNVLEEIDRKIHCS